MNESSIISFVTPIFKHFGQLERMLNVMPQQIDGWIEFFNSHGFGNDNLDLAITYRCRFIESAKAMDAFGIFNAFTKFVRDNGIIKDHWIRSKLNDRSDCEACEGDGGFLVPVVNRKTGLERECFFRCRCDRGKLLFGGFAPHQEATGEMMAWQIGQKREFSIA